MSPSPHPSRAGFSLVEMMVASFISVLLVASLMSAYIQQRRTFRIQQDAGEMQQNVRSAMDVLTHDLRNAGYGLPVPSSRYPDWVTWTGGITGPVTITAGVGGSPDAVTVVGAFGVPEGTLVSATAAQSTTLTLGSGQGDAFNITTRSLIRVGRVETARVTGVNGNVLTISTSPTAAGAGLRYAHPVNTPVEIVKAVRYEIRNGTGTSFPTGPFLARVDLGLSSPSNRDVVQATLIENLQVAQVHRDVEVTLSGRVRQPDPYYTHPVAGDGFRRFDLASAVYLRNQPNP